MALWTWTGGVEGLGSGVARVEADAAACCSTAATCAHSSFVAVGGASSSSSSIGGGDGAGGSTGVGGVLSASVAARKSAGHSDILASSDKCASKARRRSTSLECGRRARYARLRVSPSE